MYHLKNKKKNELSAEEEARLFADARNQLQKRASVDETEGGSTFENVELDTLKEGTSSAKKEESNLEFETIPLGEEKSIAN